MTLRPFLSMWTHPRSTVRAITVENPGLFVLPLAMLAGIEQSLVRAADSQSTPPPLPIVIPLVLVIGSLWGPFSLWLGSFLLGWAGNWLDGHSPRKHLRTALAWSAVPTVVALLLWVPRLLFFGADTFASRLAAAEPPRILLFTFVLNLLDLTLAIWSIVLLCNAVAEVQGFRSAWKGLANLFLAGMILVVPLIVLAFVLVVFRGS